MNSVGSLRLYHVPSVVCALDAPIEGPAGEGPLSHYSRSYYVVADGEDDAMALIRAEERKCLASVLDFDPPIAVDLMAVPRDMRAALKGGRGIKWKSGRAFFPAS